MKTLQQILGGKNLCGVIEAVKGGVPGDVLPPAFLKATRTVEGNTGTYRKVQGTRKVARLATYGSPSRVRQLSGVSEVPITLLHSIESHNHSPSTLVNLQNMEDESRQRLGEQEVARQTAEFKQLFTNLRIAAVYSAIAHGAIYYDTEGNLLASDTGSKVDYGVPAAGVGGSGNKGHLADAAGNASIIGAIGAGTGPSYKWSTATVKIHLQVKALRKAARKLTGYPLKYAFYGDNILDYFLSNNTIQNIMSRNSKIQDAIQGGEIPDDFMKLKWIPAGEAFFQDADGVNQDIFDANTVVFTPEIDRTWYELIDGTYPVPTNIGNLTEDASAALGSVIVKSGVFSYAKVTDDPVGIKQVAGDTFLPVIKVPAAIFIATVHW